MTYELIHCVSVLWLCDQGSLPCVDWAQCNVSRGCSISAGSSSHSTNSGFGVLFSQATRVRVAYLIKVGEENVSLEWYDTLGLVVETEDPVQREGRIDTIKTARNTHTHTHTNLYMRMHTHVCAHAHTHVCMHIGIQRQTRNHKH